MESNRSATEGLQDYTTTESLSVVTMFLVSLAEPHGRRHLLSTSSTCAYQEIRQSTGVRWLLLWCWTFLLEIAWTLSL